MDEARDEQVQTESARAQDEAGHLHEGTIGGFGSAASWLFPYAGQPPRGTAGRSLPDDKRWLNGTRQRAIRRARRGLNVAAREHEAVCALPRCAAAGVTVCTRLPGAHKGALDVERAEKTSTICSKRWNAFNLKI